MYEAACRRQLLADSIAPVKVGRLQAALYRKRISKLEFNSASYEVF